MKGYLPFVASIVLGITIISLNTQDCYGYGYENKYSCEKTKCISELRGNPCSDTKRKQTQTENCEDSKGKRGQIYECCDDDGSHGGNGHEHENSCDAPCIIDARIDVICADFKHRKAHKVQKCQEYGRQGYKCCEDHDEHEQSAGTNKLPSVFTAVTFAVISYLGPWA